MNWLDIFTPTLISAIISTIVTFSIKALISQRYKIDIANLQNKHNAEIEVLKAQLMILTTISKEKTERRLKAYPKITELIYRTRNICREIDSKAISFNSYIIPELNNRVKELEDCLYEYRLDLDSDGLFMEVHKYKNCLLNFCYKVSDLKYFYDNSELERAEHVKTELSEIYKVIEESHAPIIKDLSSVSYSSDKENK
jgi:hypothetical protein